MSKPNFPLLEIAAFVDSTTVILIGSGVSSLEEDDELYVLGIGDIDVPKVNVPLVIPKASLEVTAQAGEYAIARPPAERREVPGPFASMATDWYAATQTVIRRQPLTKDDKQFLGNPARGSVNVGDVVVRKKDLANYIEYRAKEKSLVGTPPPGAK